VGRIRLDDLQLEKAAPVPHRTAGSTATGSDGDRPWVPIAAGFAAAILAAGGCAMALRRRRRHAVS